jgi:hypothetical protein
MDTPFDAGDAAYTLYYNAMVQAQTRSAYHESGGQVTPGTDSAQITVAVDGGEATINDTNVSWAPEEVVLEDGGVGPGGSDQGAPRVDVVYVKQNGALAAATGEPHAYLPDTDAAGDPITPAEFEHWEPSPDDGRNVGGVMLGLVLVEADDAVAADITTSEIKNWKVGGAESGVYIRGDGQDNGPIDITVTGDPVTIQDSDSGAVPFDYQPSENKVTIGSSGAQPYLGDNLIAQGNTINGLNTLAYQDGAYGSLQFDSSTGTTWKLRDANTTPATPVIEVDSSTIHHRRKTNYHGERIADSGGFEWIGGDGDETLFRIDDGSTNPTSYSGRTTPGTNAGGGPFVFELFDITNISSLFSVNPNGVGQLRDGGTIDGTGPPHRIATRTWADSQFYSTAGGFIDIESLAADPPNPESGEVRIYESGGRVEAKDANGNVALLGSF